MVRPISDEDRRLVLDLWLQGKSYRKIKAETGIGLGTITAIIDQTRQNDPDIDELRRLQETLTKTKVSPTNAQRGAMFLEMLRQLNIPTEKVGPCIGLLERYGAKAGEVLELGLRLRELEASQGKYYEQIVADASEKVKQRQTEEKKVEDLRRQAETISKSIPELEQLRDINLKMSQHGLAVNRLDEIIQHVIKLKELNFSPAAAELLAKELMKRGFDPQTSAAALAILLSRYQSLEESVATLTKERNGLQQDIATKRTELEDGKRQVQTMKAEIENLKELIKKGEDTYRTQYGQLLKEYKAKFDALEADIQAKTEKIKELESEDKLVRTRLEEAQKLLTKFEENLVKIRPLKALSLLMDEPESPIEQTTLLKAITGLIEGLKTHVRANPNLVSDPTNLTNQLEEINLVFADELRLVTRKTQ